VSFIPSSFVFFAREQLSLTPLHEGVSRGLLFHAATRPLSFGLHICVRSNQVLALFPRFRPRGHHVPTPPTPPVGPRSSPFFSIASPGGRPCPFSSPFLLCEAMNIFLSFSYQTRLATLTGVLAGSAEFSSVRATLKDSTPGSTGSPTESQTHQRLYIWALTTSRSPSLPLGFGAGSFPLRHLQSSL